jgi:hypothetical protein
LTHVLQQTGGDQQTGNVQKEEMVQRQPKTTAEMAVWYSASPGGVKHMFESYTKSLLEPLLVSAIEISKSEKERYFGRNGEIDELVDLIKDEYGEKYKASDMLRARALIRFSRDEKVSMSSGLGLWSLLRLPLYYENNQEEIAASLMTMVKHHTSYDEKYNPGIFKEIMAAYVFKRDLAGQYTEGSSQYDEKKRNAPFKVRGNDLYPFDMDALNYVLEKYPELYQAEMLDAMTTSTFRTVDVEKYPVLADVRTDFAYVSRDDKRTIKRTIKNILDEREKNSQSLYDKLGKDPEIIWEFAPLIEFALKELGFSKEYYPGSIIWEEYKRRELNETIISWLLGGLGIIIGIAGAVTGGLGYGVAAAILGGLGATISFVDLCIEIEEYALHSYASEATYEVAMSDKPSPLGIFVAIIGLVLDVWDVSSGVTQIIKKVSMEAAEEMGQAAIKSMDEADDILRKAYDALSAKGVIKNISPDEFIAAIKNSTGAFPRAFSSLPQTPAMYKAFAASPEAFTRMLAEGGDDVYRFMVKYGDSLSYEDIMKYMGTDASTMRKIAQQFLAIDDLPVKWKQLFKKLMDADDIELIGIWEKAPLFDEDVIVYHGSRHNNGEILERGLHNKIPTNASLNKDAALDALHNYYGDTPTDFGIIESKIPKEIWNILSEKGHIFERFYPGFSGKLNSSELRFNSEFAIEAFNLGIISKKKI